MGDGEGPTGYSLGDVLLKRHAPLADPILRGARIQKASELVLNRYNLAVTCLDCQHRGVIDGRRFYFHFMQHSQWDDFELFAMRLRCSACRSRKLVTRATLENAGDDLPEADSTHCCMDELAIRRR